MIIKFILTFLILSMWESIQLVPLSDTSCLNELYCDELNEDNYNFSESYAKLMLSYMNKSVDPCDDFYEFSCGNWKNVIEKKQAHHKRNNLLDIAYILGDMTEEIIKKETYNQSTDYIKELKLGQTLYRSCLSANLFPTEKSQAYLKEIKSIGGFPAIDNTWDPKIFSWFNMSSHLSNYGIVGFINDEIVPQYPFLPYFKIPELGFDIVVQTDNILSKTSNGYKLNNKRMRSYLAMYDVEELKTNKIIESIFELWYSILKVGDRFGNNFENCEGMSKEPFDQWNNYYLISWLGKNFNMSEAECPCHFFYRELDAICETRKETVANYLAMKFLYNMDARLEDRKFQRDYCIFNLQHSLPYLIDPLYMSKYFSLAIYDEVNDLIGKIQESVHNILVEAEWLDEETRAEALLKESTIKTRIGKFEDPIITDRLIREMNNLTFENDTFEENYIRLRKFKTFIKRYNGLHFEQISNDSKPLELLIAMQVNSFYYNVDNSINVMAGILHPPAYDKSWPISLKYGTLGYLIGHEFTHGFDTVGAFFDSEGNERYWWSKKSSQAFYERAECFVQHYSTYLIPEINRNINGNLTKDENLADSGGLRVAWAAYQKHMKILYRNSSEQFIPHLNMSYDQIFFLGFAQLWCASYKEEHYWEELVNEHTIDKYRVLGCVTNNAEFSKVFNCPLGSKMNPKTKCRVW